MRRTITLLILSLLVAFNLPAQKGQIFQTGSEGPVYDYSVVAGEPRPYYDAGGPDRNMRDNLALTIIQLKPVNADSHITIVFEEMELGEFDQMRFYPGAIELWNGPDEEGYYYYDWPKDVEPILALKGNPANPKFSVVSTASDGCMSVAFQHNSTAKGWKGMIYCVKNGDPEPQAGGEPGISFTTVKEIGSSITLSISANGEVSAEGLKLPDGQTHLTKDTEVSYEITAQEIRLIGDITTLETNGNGLSMINLQEAENLKTLECGENQLQTLDFSHNPQIKRIKCGSNQLESLTLEGCSDLGYLDCSDNKLTSLDLSTNSGIWSLWCESNQLSALDVSACKELMYFTCSDNRLTAIDLSKNSELEQFFCDGNAISSIDLSGCANLNTAACSENEPLTSLKLPQSTSFEFLTTFRTGLSHESIRQIIDQLPARFDEKNVPLDPTGSLILQVKGEENPVKVFAEDIEAAAKKNWALFQYDEESEDVTAPTERESITQNSTWQVRLRKEVLTITNAPIGKEVSLYAMDGTLCLRSSLTAETTSMDISRLPSGVYLVTIGALSRPIIK